MFNKIALMVELCSAAKELDHMGKFYESDKLFSTMKVLAADVDTSLLSSEIGHGEILNKREQASKALMERFNEQSRQPIVPEPVIEKKKLSMRDVINTYNSIMAQKGYKYGKGLMLGKSWKELDSLVKRYFGIKAGRDYLNWKQMISALQSRAIQVPTITERLKSDFKSQKELVRPQTLTTNPLTRQHVPA